VLSETYIYHLFITHTQHLSEIIVVHVLATIVVTLAEKEIANSNKSVKQSSQNMVLTIPNIKVYILFAKFTYVNKRVEIYW
jgi:hypothetical protein